MSASSGHDLSAQFPEIARNQKRIQLIKAAQERQLCQAAKDKWGEGKPGYNQYLFGWQPSAFFDRGFVGCELARQDVEDKFASFGGRDHTGRIACLRQKAAARSAGVDQPLLKANDSRTLENRFYEDSVEFSGGAGTFSEVSRNTPSRRKPMSKVMVSESSPFKQDPSLSVGKRKLKSKKTAVDAEGLEIEERDIRLERMLAGVSSPVTPAHSPMAKPRPRVNVPYSAARGHSNAGQHGHDARFLGDERLETTEQTRMMRPISNARSTPSRNTTGDRPVVEEEEDGVRMPRPLRGYGDEAGGAFSPQLATRALHAAHLSPVMAMGGGRASNVDIAHTTTRGTAVHARSSSLSVGAGAVTGPRGWGADVMALRAAAGKGEGVHKLQLASPLSGLERNVLSLSPWRQPAAAVDPHDQVVLAGMPYRASATVRSEGALRSLGNVVQSRDAAVRTAAVAAIGDKSNFADPTCLAYLVPLLSDPDPSVRAAALRAVAQVAEPGQSRSYMEVEVEVFGASSLPKKDRFGACDGYVTLELRNVRTGGVAKEDRTRIVWRELNPRWRQTYYWEVRAPEEEELSFAVWDEDGASDDLVGRCTLPLSVLEFDEATGDRPLLAKSLQLLAEDRETKIHGYNDATFRNDGPPSRLQVRARYVAYLRPQDLMAAFTRLLDDGDVATRAEALRTVMAFGVRGDEVVVSSLLKMLADTDHDIRMSAARALSEFAERNDDVTVTRVAALLDHDVERVRLAAVQALGRVCDKGHPVTVSEVLLRIKSHDPAVRQLVPDAITAVAEPHDPLARGLLVAALGDERADVRECALLTLLTMSTPGELALLEDVRASLDDVSHLCRWAAVNVIFRVGSVKPEDEQAPKQRALDLLRGVLALNHGSGDPSPMVRQAAARKLDALQVALPRTFVMAAAPTGQYSATLPAAYVGFSSEKGVYSYPVDPMPVDTKFHSSLPYRPPTPPWEPKAQAKVALRETKGKAQKHLSVTLINIDDMTAEAARREATGRGLSVSEGMELEEKRRQAEALSQQIAECDAELLAVGGVPEVQPPNTTKLGFTVDTATRKGDHCQLHQCMRSAFY